LRKKIKGSKLKAQSSKWHFRNVKKLNRTDPTSELRIAICFQLSALSFERINIQAIRLGVLVSNLKTYVSGYMCWERLSSRDLPCRCMGDSRLESRSHKNFSGDSMS
jgi:hypothetical protein